MGPAPPVLDPRDGAEADAELLSEFLDAYAVGQSTCDRKCLLVRQLRDRVQVACHRFEVPSARELKVCGVRAETLSAPRPYTGAGRDRPVADRPGHAWRGQVPPTRVDPPVSAAVDGAEPPPAFIVAATIDRAPKPLRNVAGFHIERFHRTDHMVQDPIM